ncbi:MAG: alpha/beta hydrolase [bacterium]|nr:alpha/beta hydrolase [bacterium]
MSTEAELQQRLEGVDVLVLPGWRNSGPDHWQSRWEDKFPEWSRVQQDNWLHPQRSDWVRTLDEYIAASSRPLLLIAHSLGCITVAHWAAQSAHAGRVAAALLVAPADVERSTVASSLRSFAPVPAERLPFPALMIGSDNDHACTAWRACEFADAWGARFHLLGGAGHINADSRLGDWEGGLELLHHWLQQALPQTSASATARSFRWAA